MSQRYDVIIIGAGLTGLTTALNLAKEGKKIAIIEKENQAGGQIQTHSENGFTFETGPNTAVVSNYEVIDLFNQLDNCEIEIAKESAKKRLIYKDGSLYPLPSGLIEGITTPLFKFSDKLNVLLEPFRKKGSNPDESVAEIAERRLGKSFVDYAVDPFISGIYAGDPAKLVTRFALPKLYNLEQDYGSFIKGAIKKAKMPKTEKEKLVSKKVFSARNGLGQLTKAIKHKLETTYKDNVDLYLNAQNASLNPSGNYLWEISFLQNKNHTSLQANYIVPTIGSYEYEKLMPFLSTERLKPITQLIYAPVIQISIGIKEGFKYSVNAFGALMPGKEKRNILGILFPSDCFSQRSDKDGLLVSIFMGGTKNRDIFTKNDQEIENLVRKE
ncbi:MAG: protoporphyrinogen oxidase, partial [Bacteroidales bacterium]